MSPSVQRPLLFPPTPVPTTEQAQSRVAASVCQLRRKVPRGIRVGPNASSDTASQNSGHFFFLCLHSLLLPAKCLLSTYYVSGTVLGAEAKAVMYSFTQIQTSMKHLLCARQRSCNGCNTNMVPKSMCWHWAQIGSSSYNIIAELNRETLFLHCANDIQMDCRLVTSLY